MIIYKSEDEIRSMRRSNQIVAKILAELAPLVKPGVQTKDLNEYAEKRTREMDAKPAFKEYRGYPASLCTSINEEIVHGVIICPKCLRWYPIRDEIPEMLPDELREEKDELPFLRKWKDKFPRKTLLEGKPFNLGGKI